MNELNTLWTEWNNSHSAICGPVLMERTLEGVQTTYVFLFPQNDVAERIRLQKGYSEREAQFKAFFKRMGWTW